MYRFGFPHLLSAFIQLSIILCTIGCQDYVFRQESVYSLSEQTVTTPLLHPLTNARPYVRGTLSHRNHTSSAKKLVDLTFLVDTGAGNYLPRGFFDTLNAEQKEAHGLFSVDAHGRRTPWSGGIIDHVKLGEAVFRDNVFGVAEHKIIGRNILNTISWSLDLDRGVITWNDTLGAPKTSGDHTSLDFIKRDQHYHVQAHINGKLTLLVFDTGADQTYVREDALKARGAILKKLKTKRTVRALSGKAELKSFYSIELKLGDLAVQKSISMVKPGETSEGLFNEAVSGLLGFTDLAKYRFTYIPKKRVILQPRRSTMKTRRSRMERWSFVPKTCKAPGCATPTLEYDPKARTLDISVNFEQRYTRPMSVTIACLKSDGEVNNNLPFLILYNATASPRKPWTHRINLSSVRVRNVMLRTLENNCGQNAIVDINPVLKPRIKHGPSRLHFALPTLMDIERRLTLNDTYRAAKEEAKAKAKAKE